jgi:hypothetical protein
MNDEIIKLPVLKRLWVKARKPKPLKFYEPDSDATVIQCQSCESYKIGGLNDYLKYNYCPWCGRRL